MKCPIKRYNSGQVDTLVSCQLFAWLSLYVRAFSFELISCSFNRNRGLITPYFFTHLMEFHCEYWMYAKYSNFFKSKTEQLCVHMCSFFLLWTSNDSPKNPNNYLNCIHLWMKKCQMNLMYTLFICFNSPQNQHYLWSSPQLKRQHDNQRMQHTSQTKLKKDTNQGWVI